MGKKKQLWVNILPTQCNPIYRRSDEYIQSSYLKFTDDPMIRRPTIILKFHIWIYRRSDDHFYRRSDDPTIRRSFDIFYRRSDDHDLVFLAKAYRRSDDQNTVFLTKVTDDPTILVANFVKNYGHN